MNYCPICGSEKYPCEHEKELREKAKWLRDMLEDNHVNLKTHSPNVLIRDEHGHAEVV